MTLRALCDTNVLVSAFIAGGPPSRVLEAVIDGRIELVLADPVLGELERVLSVKLGFEPERVREIRVFLIDLASGRVGAPKQAPQSLTGDREDDVILACAVATGSMCSSRVIAGTCCRSESTAAYASSRRRRCSRSWPGSRSASRRASIGTRIGLCVR